ncbi:hypothetical protein BG015_001596 [Linnemannia schmuckeri]|uniref:Uncharacterized protein n=1 Tax=Linnemannia schmuckeri TaxID=64567 RepID=A0A9P5V6Y1_9FUNG|nr:hypothetical protein BG015_001596 [Linnemannia schmuckeri]
MSADSRPLTIHDLFFKASSSTSVAQDHDHQQGDVLSIVGQVVHSINSSRISRLAAEQDQELDQELDGFPLHPAALSTFKARGDGSLPDQVVWLGPLQTAADDLVDLSARRPASRSASNTRPTSANNKNLKERNKQDHIVVILDSDDEEEMQEPLTAINERPLQPSNNEQEGNDGASSCVSWSDSNASRSETEEQFEDTLPMTIVAVLLHFASQQSGLAFAQSFKRGDVVEVTGALMLQQELACSRVVTCVGIAGTTFYRIYSTRQDMRTELPGDQLPVRKPPVPAKKSTPITVPSRGKGSTPSKARKRSRSDTSSTCGKGSTPSKAQKRSRLGTVSTCGKGSTPSRAQKRSRSSTVVLDDDSDENVVWIPESPKDKKRTKRDEQGVDNSSAPLLKPWSHQVLHSGELDPLNTLIRHIYAENIIVI